MKLVKIVKLQRVRYGDLGEGAEYKSIHAMSSESANKRTGSEWDAVWANEWVTPMDTDKYPPESVTYNIEGIPDSEMHECGHWGSPGPSEIGFSTEDQEDCVLWFGVDEIETRYI